MNEDLLRVLLEPSFTGVPTDEQLLALGYARPVRRLADGRICAIMPVNSWTDALCVGIGPWGHRDAYYYRHGEAAPALDAWEGEGEPAGWNRHPQSGRRRPEGDASHEYVQP